MIPDNAVLQLASLLVAQEVTSELLTTLQNPGVRQMLVALEPELEDLLSRDWTPRDYEDAAVEFCRLFILNPAVPARAAAWLDDKPDEIASRIQFMLDQGFLVLPEPYHNLTPDHLSILLLIQCSLGEEDDGQFWADNVSPWVPRFAQQIQEQSSSPLYRLVGRLLSRSQSSSVGVK